MDSLEGMSAIISNLFSMVVIAVFVVSLWKIFVKMGKPGWAALIPFYNSYLLLTALGKPGWWLVLYFVPIANLVVVYIVSVALAKAFGKSTLFGILGLFLFGIVGYPMLAFGSAKYMGGNVSASTPPTIPVSEPPLVVPGTQVPAQPTQPAQAAQPAPTVATPIDPNTPPQK